MRRSIALLAVLLAGCYPSPGGRSGAAPVSSNALAGWRMLSRDAPGAKAKPKPDGFVEARTLGGSASASAYYLVYDKGYRPVGHVTARGSAFRYAASGRIQDKPAGEGPVLEQMAKLLGLEGLDKDLRVYSLDGKPGDLP